MGITILKMFICGGILSLALYRAPLYSLFMYHMINGIPPQLFSGYVSTISNVSRNNLEAKIP